MKFETLEEFIVFAKHLSFSKAADELFISQPALSMHMSSLEKEIGVALIKRSGRPSLTPAGLIFLKRCQVLLEMYHAAIEEAHEATASLLPARILDNERSYELHLLAAFVKDVPYALVNAEEKLPIWQAIEKDVADLGLGLDYTRIPSLKKKADEQGLDCFPVGIAKLGIAVMKTHPLAQKDHLKKEDLYKYAIGIGTGSDFDVWKLLFTDLIKPEKPLKFRLDPVGGHSNLSFVDFGDHVHVYVFDVLNSFVRNRDDIIIFDTLDGKPLEMTSVIVYDKNSANPNVKDFVERLREVTSSPDYPALPHSLT